jgi:N-acetylmuramoyl-L-alanine amidase
MRPLIHVNRRTVLKPIIIGSGHGDVWNGEYTTDKTVGGKQSPLWKSGKKVYEGQSVKDLAYGIVCELRKMDVPAVLLNPEIEDIPLLLRSKRENDYYNFFKGKSIYIELHHNAQPTEDAPYTDNYGFGGWTHSHITKAARGTEIWTSPGETKADPIAKYIMDSISKNKLKDIVFGPLRGYSKTKADKEAYFHMLTKTLSPAMIFEWLFMTSEDDCNRISSNYHREKFIQIMSEILFNISTL